MWVVRVRRHRAKRVALCAAQATRVPRWSVGACGARIEHIPAGLARHFEGHRAFADRVRTDERKAQESTGPLSFPWFTRTYVFGGARPFFHIMAPQSLQCNYLKMFCPIWAIS